MIQTPEQRQRGLQGLRSLLAFLEAHPEVPAPMSGTLYEFLLREHGTEEARFDELFDIADALGTPVTADSDGDRKTELRFDLFTFTVIAQTDRKPDPARRRTVTRPSAHPEAVSAS